MRHYPHFPALDSRVCRGDIFFDFEGDPFVDEGGLEFLFGYAFKNDAGAESYLDLLRQFGYRLSVIGTDGDQDDAGIMSLAREPGKDQVDLLAWPLSIWPR